MEAGWTVSTLAGGTKDDDAEAPANLGTIGGLAIGPAGEVFLTDKFKHQVRMVTPDGKVSTLAGSGAEGSADATGLAASFSFPEGIVAGAGGDLFVADTGRVRRVTRAGAVTTIAGGPKVASSLDAVDGTGALASFFGLGALAADASGTLFALDHSAVRTITPAGAVTTRVPGLMAKGPFVLPDGLAVAKDGTIFVSDQDRIARVSATGAVTTFVGGTSGYADGSGTAARFKGPQGLAFDGAGNLFVADSFNNRIRKVTPAGVVSTIAGGPPGYVDGKGEDARFSVPEQVAVDGAGQVYVSDLMNTCIRVIKRAP